LDFFSQLRMKTLRIPSSRLAESARVRGDGFTESILAIAERDGEYLVIPVEAWHRLTERHGLPGQTQRIAEPSIADLASNFATAISRWTAAGFSTVTREQYDARAAVCDACEYWDGNARLGLGKCGAPGCGCTAMKRWLSTEKCPLGKWPSL